MDELLVRMLAPALGRNIGDRAFEKLQQRLLHPLAGHIARDGGILALARDLIDLVDIDDAALRALHVEVRRLQQLEDHIFHVLADIAGLGQRGRVRDGKGHVEHLRHRLRKERLAAAGGADQQDIAFLQLHLVLASVQDALIVVIHRHGQHDLGALLADHIIVQLRLDLNGLRQLLKHEGKPVIALAPGIEFRVVFDDVHAHADAFVADIASVAGDQPVDQRLRLSAKGTADASSAFITCHTVLP